MKKEKIISSMIYKFTERVLVKGLGLVISILLARLLDPEHFGQLAILMVFINLSQTLINGGLNTALVQKKDADELDFSVVYYLTSGVALVMIAILFFSAPAIAKFYGSDDLILPLRVYSFVLLFGAFNSVQVAKLQKTMRFKSMMWANLFATILAGSLGVLFAFLNFGIWALVIYNFAQIVFVSFAMLFIVKWFPKWQFSFKRAKGLFGFGWKMLLSSIFTSLYNDIRALVIGKKFTTEDLGQYNKGQQFPDVIANSLDQSVQSVMFPALANEQDNKAKVRAMIKRSLSLNALIVFPVMAGFALVAHPFVSVILTEKWLPCVFFLQMSCVAWAHVPFTSSNLTALKAIGRSDTYMIIEFIRRIMMLGVLLISIFCFNTVEAIAIGYAISSWIDVIIVLIPMKKFFGYGIFSQFKDVFKNILAVALMAGCTWAVSLLPLGALSTMLLQILVGMITYVAFCALLKVESFYYLLNILKKAFSSKKKNNQQTEDGQKQTENENLNNDNISGGGRKRFTLAHCDFAKVIMMLTVIVYHCICLWSRGSWFTESAENSMVLAYLCALLNNVHVYVFAFVSGFLFYFLKYEKNRYRTPLKDIKGRASRLLKPYVIVSLVWVIPFAILMLNNSITDIFHNFVLAENPGQLWFLVMLFMLFVIFYFMADLFNKANFICGALLSVLCYGVGLVGNMFLPNVFQIFAALRFMPFYWLGFYFKKNQNNFFYKIPFVVYLIAFLGVFSVNYLFLSESESTLFKLASMVASPVSCLLGVLTVIIGLSKINPKKICETKVFKFLQKHNFTMYLFHQQLIYITITLLNGVAGIPVVLLANLVISIGGSILISVLISVGKKYFGYKK